MNAWEILAMNQQSDRHVWEWRYLEYARAWPGVRMRGRLALSVCWSRAAISVPDGLNRHTTTRSHDDGNRNPMTSKLESIDVVFHRLNERGEKIEVKACLSAEFGYSQWGTELRYLADNQPVAQSLVDALEEHWDEPEETPEWAR
jgi:hypothetical protein